MCFSNCVVFMGGVHTKREIQPAGAGCPNTVNPHLPPLTHTRPPIPHPIPSHPQVIVRTWVGGLQLDCVPHKDTEMVVIKPVRGLGVWCVFLPPMHFYFLKNVMCVQ